MSATGATSSVVVIDNGGFGSGSESSSLWSFDDGGSDLSPARPLTAREVRLVGALNTVVWAYIGYWSYRAVKGAVAYASQTVRRNALYVQKGQKRTGARPAHEDPAAAAAALATVSERMRHIVLHDETPIQNANHFRVKADPENHPPYHWLWAPRGYISCAIAENKCCSQFMPNYILRYRPGLGTREMSYQDFNV